MDRRNLGAGLMVLASSMLLMAGTASARPAVIPQTSNVAEATNCTMNSLPGLMRQGEFSQVGDVGDVIQIGCNPAVFPGGTVVGISDTELYDRCKLPDGTIHWATLIEPEAEGPEVYAVLDGDGNATVDLVAGPNCAVGGTVVSANTLVGYGSSNTVVESFSAGFAVEPAVPSTEGVTVEPKEQVEDEVTSSASTLIEAEFGSTEAKVRVGAPELDGRCEVGGSLFLRPDGELVPAEELAGGENKVDPTGDEAIATDDDGNAFVIAIGFGSCKPGKSYFKVDEEASPFNGEEVPFTILPPAPTPF